MVQYMGNIDVRRRKARMRVELQNPSSTYMRDIPVLICGIITSVLLFLSIAYHDGALALFSFPFALLTIFGGLALHTYNANKAFASQKRQIEQTYNVELDISRKQFAKMLDGNKHAVYSPWRKKKDGTIIRKCYLLR